MIDDDRHFAMTTLDVQTDMFRYWARSSVGQRYVEEIVRLNIDVEANEDKTSAYLAMSVIENSLTGPTYAVTENIVDVIESALASLDKNEMLHLEESDVPYPAGFVLLQRPVMATDNFGKPLVIRAISWTVINISSSADPNADKYPALWLLAWTDPSDERDHLYGEWLKYKDKIPTPHHLMPLPAGTYVLDSRVSARVAGDEAKVTLFLLVFFLFIQELWVDPRMIDPGRAARRRRQHLTKIAPPSVSVVQLRRSASQHQPPAGENPQEWSHRWLVRGHWRNQWYPSSQTHRPRWIPEHIKGPDDKPLIVKEKIFSVSR